MTKQEKLAKKQARIAKKQAKQQAKLAKQQSKLEKLELKHKKEQKKKQKLEISNHKKLLETLRVSNQVLIPNGTDHRVFIKIPKELEVKPHTEPFKRVVLARFFEDNHSTYFLRYYKKGEPGFPFFDGCKIYNETLQQAGYYPIHGVVLHPSGQVRTLFDITDETHK